MGCLRNARLGTPASTYHALAPPHCSKMDFIDPDASSTGTKFALSTILLATLPTFLSANNISTHLLPRIPERTISESFYLRFHPRPFVLLSPKYTVLTHIFHHHGVTHWVSNTYALFANGISLDAGFLPTWALFIGGGLFSALSLIVERSWKASKMIEAPSMPGFLPESMGKWLASMLAPPPRIVVACGSSGAVFALMGANVSRTWARIAELSSAGSNRSRGRRTNNEKVRLMTGLYWNLIHIGFQVYALVAGPPTSLVWDGLNDVGGGGGGSSSAFAGAEVAHSAHVGGFVFGLVVAELVRRFL